jgi:FkbM family methyltransferase
VAGYRRRRVRFEPLVPVLRGLGSGIRLPFREFRYLGGSYERPVQAALAEHLGPGDIFWDIGAHVGFFTMLGSRLVGASGRVHAFEPHPANRRRIEAVVAANRALNVEVHELAIMSSTGETALRGHKSTAMWSLMENFGTGERLAIRCSTLDDLCGIEPPRVMKVDVEGVEYEVMRGGTRFLNEHLPVLIVEFFPSSVPYAERLLPAYAFEPLGDGHWIGRAR